MRYLIAVCSTSDQPISQSLPCDPDPFGYMKMNGTQQLFVAFILLRTVPRSSFPREAGSWGAFFAEEQSNLGGLGKSQVVP